MILGILRDRLLTSTAVTDIVDDRVYPFNLTQEAVTPAADMRIVSGTAFGHLTGILGFQSSNVTIDCYHDEDQSIADQIVMAMMKQGLLFGWSTANISGISIRGIDPVAGLTQSIEGVGPGSNRPRYVSSFSVRVHWSYDCA